MGGWKGSENDRQPGMESKRILLQMSVQIAERRMDCRTAVRADFPAPARDVGRRLVTA